MSKIEINNVYKIFGNNPKSIIPMVKDGASKEDILEKTGHTVGGRKAIGYLIEIVKPLVTTHIDFTPRRWNIRQR